MTSIDKPRVIVIAGPTASGKSSLSVNLASATGGEIVNADSMQVYRGMDIGTAKPTREERKGIPHHLLDIVEPDEEFNAAIYRSTALEAIDDIIRRDRTCLITGGTGLYIKALLGGLVHCPPVDEGLRASLREELSQYGPEGLYKRLMNLDPDSAKKIHPNDGIRITRALEIISLTDTLPSDLNRGHGFGENALHVLKIYLEVDREELYKRIDERTEAMVESGLVEETRDLLEKGYSPDLKSMNAIGYRHMVNFLKGKWSFEEACRLLKRDTRRYAKRQMTWFRADSDAVWIPPDKFNTIFNKIKAFLHETS